MNKTELLEKYKDTLLKIVYRNGNERYLLNDKIYAPDGEMTYKLDLYNEDLIDKDRTNKSVDIMKIFKCDGSLIWERRKEKPRLTAFEKELLCVFSKEYDNIGRFENDDDLFLDGDDDSFYALLPALNKYFGFIKHGEYYSIQELLED